jgi:hypothetical protein
VNVELSVFEIVGSSYCFSPDDGQRVYNRLAAAIKTQQYVELSFHNIAVVTSAFLNTAIGQLYGNFSEEAIRRQLKVQGVESHDLALLKLVVESAKQYFDDGCGQDRQPVEGAIA